MKSVKDVDGRLTVDWDSVELTVDHLRNAHLLKNKLTCIRDSYLLAHEDLKRVMGDYSVEIVITVKI